MAVTLEQAKLNVQDDLQIGVIDEFAKSNFLLSNLTFDNCVSPTGGSSLTYAYTRLLTQPTASFRNVNSEYTPSEVTKKRFFADLKIFGGSFETDRIVAGMNGAIDEVKLQLAQKIKAAGALFNETVICGDSEKDIKTFDGLDKALTGSSTEFIPEKEIDLSSSALVTANYTEFLDVLDEFLMGLDGTPSFIGGNTKLIAKLRAVARRAGMYQVSKDNFGNQVEWYGNVPFIDFGTKCGTNEPIVSIDEDGLTSLYAARLGLDGLHGVSMANSSPIKCWLPDYSTAGAVKKGEVEMVAAVVLKATKAAGVMRSIKVQ